MAYQVCSGLIERVHSRDDIKSIQTRRKAGHQGDEFGRHVSQRNPFRSDRVQS